MSLTKVTYSMVSNAPANPVDFGADPTGVSDSTAAFVAAQQASKYVYVPAGTYKVIGLRIYDQVNLIGAGYENTVFVQGDPAQPAINCTSDVITGQLISLRLENFGVTGHASATVAAVKLEALGAYAIYRSSFDFIVQNSYRALEIQAYTANNVFWCDFKIDSVNTADTSVVINGGTYNTFDLFLAGSDTNKAVDEAGFNNTFIRCVTEGQIASSGQNTVFIAPVVENLPGPGLLNNQAVIKLTGFNQKLITPTIILDNASSAKVTYAFAPFSGASIENPQILSTATLAYPFKAADADWTLIGPGRNDSATKIEDVYTGADASTNLRRVSMVGDTSAFSGVTVAISGKTIQRADLGSGANINYTIKPETDAMIFNLAGPAVLINVSSGYTGYVPDDGQTLTVFANDAIASMSWTIGSTTTSAFPTSMTANQKFTMIYDASVNVWWPIA